MKFTDCERLNKTPVKGKNCQTFYMCSNNYLYDISCAPDNLFDEKSGKCVQSSLVSCKV